VSTPEDALRDLQARQEIRDCLARCARGVDRLDADLIRSAYHPDATDDHGMFVGGREEFIAWAIDLHARAHLTHQHHLTNHLCRVDGDHAESETYFAFIGVNRPGSPGDAPTLVTSGGRYLDRLERRAGEWRIAVRVALRDWSHRHTGQVGVGAVSAVAGALPAHALALMADGLTGTRSRDDPSYTPARIDPARVARGQDSGQDSGQARR
jgi:hypothetical protein